MIGSNKACLYARYSTDRQRETSIEDQLRAARELAARHGWEVEAVHMDQGVSGSVPVALRAGGKALLADALADLQALVRDELVRRKTTAAGGADDARRRRDQLTAEIEWLVDGVARIGASAALVDRLRKAEAEHASITASLDRRQADEVGIIADVGARYRLVRIG